MARRGLGVTYRSRVKRGNPRMLCRMARFASQDQPEALHDVCRQLVQSLAQFGYEEPAAKLRAHACGWTIR